MRRILVFLGLAIGVTGAGQALAQTAGVVQFVAGEVKMVRAGGGERVARKGVPVSVGDTLVTPEGGLAQIKMGDGAIVVVQPQSRLTVAEFHYAGVEDGNEKVRYRLEQGGFRAVTGAIGRTHKKNYLIETPIAHMGVRGTDHESYYFPATGPVTPDGAKPGAYNKVNTGRTFLRTEVGEVEIQPNQVGYVASAGQVPEILVTVPGFFNHSIAPRNARKPADAHPDDADSPQVVQTVQSENGVRLLRTRGPKVTPGTGNGPLIAYSIKVGQGGFGGSGNGVDALRNDASQSEGSSGSIEWKTWAGGLAIVDGNMTAGTTHIIDSNDKTDLTALPAAMTQATYIYKGVGPLPTNQDGVAGAITNLQVGVNFGTQSVDSYVLDAQAGGTAWSSQLKTTAPHSIADFTGAGGIRLTGTCSTCGGATTSGTAHGTFVGSNADNLITTFGLSGTMNKSLTGAAVLDKQVP